MGFGKPPSFYGRRLIAKYVVNSADQQMVPDGIGRVILEYIYPPGAVGIEMPVVKLNYRDFLTRRSRFKGPLKQQM